MVLACAVVNAPSKVRFTGGTAGLLSIPIYGSARALGRAGKVPGLLSAQQAKEIFSLSAKSFKALPKCDTQYLLGNLSYPKHTRDCAAVALQNSGSFAAFAGACPLFMKADKLVRQVASFVKTGGGGGGGTF